MKAIRIFNNNAVSTIMANDKEAIVIGPGIGFNKRPNDDIDETRIEKIFYVQNEMQSKFLEMLDSVTPEMLDIAESIIKLAQDNGLALSNQSTISLIDHINFSLQRAKENIFLPNLMLSEIKMLYPKEYKIGLKALDLIEEKCHIHMPDDEAGYIALHLVSVSIDKLNTYNVLKLVKGCLDIIKSCYGLVMDETSLEINRLTTHLKFLSQRVFTKEPWKVENDNGMYDMLISLHPQNEKCIQEITDFIKNEFNYELNHQEKLYLLIHLNRIL